MHGYGSVEISLLATLDQLILLRTRKFGGGDYRLIHLFPTARYAFKGSQNLTSVTITNPVSQSIPQDF
jgi:hypothetical protein